MSRGLGTIQRTILALLDGSEKHLVYSSHGSPMDTRELLDELVERGLIDSDRPHKQNMYTVVRACRSMMGRGLVIGERAINCDFPWTRTIAWSAVSDSDPAAARAAGRAGHIPTQRLTIAKR